MLKPKQTHQGRRRAPEVTWRHKETQDVEFGYGSPPNKSESEK
jgi:hypothetical protein